MNKIANLFGFYLPTRFRRWFIFLPLNACILLLILVIALAIKGSFISGAPYFKPSPPEEALAQLSHLHGILERSAQSGRLNIFDGYTQICGQSAEWNTCFYVFYSMALRDILATHPGAVKDVRADLTWCARGILNVPRTIPEKELPAYFARRYYHGSTIYGGYVGIVLAIRKAVVGDDLFDVAMEKNAEGLAAYIAGCLEHSTEFWSSDHATQLYAIWLYDKVSGKNHQALFTRWETAMRQKFIEPKTGLLYSEVGINPDVILSEPRGSSIGWTALFLVDVMPGFAEEQYQKLCSLREERILNFEGTREFSSRSWLKFGDTDSGPLVFGMSPSATGAALCCHKLFGNEDRFTAILRTFEVFGSSHHAPGDSYYKHANALGDAILLYAKVARTKAGKSESRNPK